MRKEKRVWNLIWVVVVIGLIGAGFSPPAEAVPTLMNYQGRLMGVTGTHDMTFKIYDSATGGTLLWTEIQRSVNVDELGVFNVLLGNEIALTPAVFSADSRWLGVSIDSEAERTPRLRITSVAYAMRAATAESLAGAGAESFVLKSGDTMSGTLEVGGVVTIESGGNIRTVNLTLPDTTATRGRIIQGSNIVFHNFGPSPASYNLFVGKLAGNLTMTGNYNVGIGYGALLNNTTGL